MSGSRKAPRMPRSTLRNTATSPDQDAAVSHLSHIFGAVNPADAMQWAESLPGDSARSAAVVNIVSGWAEYKIQPPPRSGRKI